MQAETPYYTNSSHLPVGYTSDIFEALDVQDELQTLYTSGTVFHAFLGEKLPTGRQRPILLSKIAENYKIAVLYNVTRPIQSARIMDIFPEKYTNAQSAAEKQRYTAV